MAAYVSGKPTWVWEVSSLMEEKLMIRLITFSMCRTKLVLNATKNLFTLNIVMDNFVNKLTAVNFCLSLFHQLTFFIFPDIIGLYLKEKLWNSQFISFLWVNSILETTWWLFGTCNNAWLVLFFILVSSIDDCCTVQFFLAVLVSPWKVIIN